MPTRIVPFIKSPWTGGINTSVEPGALPDNDLQIANNIIFATSQARKKREGYSFYDTELPLPISRSSSGTTRYIVFASSIFNVSPADEIFVVGELIKVISSALAGNELQYVASSNSTFVTAITTTNVTNDTISYTFAGASSLTEGNTVSSTLLVKRNATYIDLLDYWRYDATFIKQQLLMAFSNQGKLFKYDAAGRRVEILPAPAQATVITTGSSALTTGDYFLLSSTTTNYYVWYNKAGGGGDPLVVGRTGVMIAVGAADSANTVANDTQVAVDALALITATVLGNVVTITQDNPGVVTDAADFNTGFTVVVTRAGRSTSAPFDSIITKANSIVFNDRFILGMNGADNRPIMFRPEDDEIYYFPLPNAPNFSMLQEHIGRIWTDDKDIPDRLNYSSPGNETEWEGDGDSAAIDIVPGDGDTDGITSIFRSFKGTLFCGKGTHLYRVDGNSPETFFITPVTKGLGCVAHKASASVDLDDIGFVSKKGIHSLSATQAYGDFQQQFLSLKIQQNFATALNRGRLDFIQSAYVADLNSVAFAVSEGSETFNNHIYLMNILSREWYRWPDISCSSLTTRFDQKSRSKLITGTNESRVITTQNGTNTDFGTMGILYRIKTGVIYPDQNVTTMKAFKYIGFIYKPTGHYRFSAQVIIDNNQYQNIAFEETAKGARLGVDFVLGTSVLGSSNQFSSFRVPIDGLGRGLTIEVTQSGTDETVELYGYIIGFEPAEDSQETL